MYIDRKLLYNKLESIYDTKIVTYITSDRQGFDAQIGQDAIDIFINQLDNVGIVKRISLFLYTRGGHTMAAWNLINLLRLYCDELEVIIPHKAHSAGTLISIGANKIIMTKQATLGPIDPSINTPLNPQIPNAPITYSVSVEAVKGYLEFAKQELKIEDDMALASILIKLSDYVHPLVLGEVYRSRAQIKMLAENLLKHQVNDSGKLDRIIAFLCSDSGSHDYTINRREARTSLGLNVVNPTQDEYMVIKAIYDDIHREMGLSEPFEPQKLATENGGVYAIPRAIIESVDGGSDSYYTKGNATLGENEISNIIIFEGWEHYEQKLEYSTTVSDQSEYRI